jgi:hypothetical protein
MFLLPKFALLTVRLCPMALGQTIIPSATSASPTASSSVPAFAFTIYPLAIGDWKGIGCYTESNGT